MGDNEISLNEIELFLEKEVSKKIKNKLNKNTITFFILYLVLNIGEDYQVNLDALNNQMNLALSFNHSHKSSENDLLTNRLRLLSSLL